MIQKIFLKLLCSLFSPKIVCPQRLNEGQLNENLSIKEMADKLGISEELCRRLEGLDENGEGPQQALL